MTWMQSSVKKEEDVDTVSVRVSEKHGSNLQEEKTETN